jgi:dTDP-4-dehydrorhamnose reductase
MKEILIIGKRGLIGNHLNKLLSLDYNIKLISFSNFTKLTDNDLKNFRFVINCSLHRKYISNKYNFKYDNDLFISKKIAKLDIIQIMLSTRKVYKPRANIKENSKTLGIDFYGKNKIITENKCKKIKNNFLILRLSNILVNFENKKNRLHKTFLNHFKSNLLKDNFVINRNCFKDFITIKQFSKIISLIVLKDLKRGTFNVSLKHKVYTYEILHWLTYFKKKKIKIINTKQKNEDSFTLNNDKLCRKLDLKLKKIDVKNYCYELSSKYFK